MSTHLQQKKMVRLAELLSQDLGYIYGERESGPNGAKAEFLRVGKAFLTQLGEDLGFSDMNVNVNKAGIAVSGEVYLRGMWKSLGVGLSVCLEQMVYTDAVILFRTIRSIDDYSGGRNNFIQRKHLTSGDYDALIGWLRLLGEDAHGRAA